MRTLTERHMIVALASATGAGRLRNERGMSSIGRSTCHFQLTHLFPCQCSKAELSNRRNQCSVPRAQSFKNRLAREWGHGGVGAAHKDWEATRSKALAGRLSGDLSIITYAYLMWDPAMHIAEISRATLNGFHRLFCLKIDIGRVARATCADGCLKRRRKM